MPGKRGLEVRSVQETGCGVGWWWWWWWGGTAAHHIEEFFGRMLYQPPLLVNGRIPHPEEGPSPIPTSAHPPPPVTLLHAHCTSVCAKNRGCEHHSSTRFIPCTAHTLLCPSSRRWPQIGGKGDRRSACASRSCGCCPTPYPHPRRPERRHGTVQERHDWNLSAHLMPGLLLFQVSATSLSFSPSPLHKMSALSHELSCFKKSGQILKSGWSKSEIQPSQAEIAGGDKQDGAPTQRLRAVCLHRLLDNVCIHCMRPFPQKPRPLHLSPRPLSHPPPTFVTSSITAGGSCDGAPPSLARHSHTQNTHTISILGRIDKCENHARSKDKVSSSPQSPTSLYLYDLSSPPLFSPTLFSLPSPLSRTCLQATR